MHELLTKLEKSSKDLPLSLFIEAGIKVTMNAYLDPLFRKGLEMFQNGEMSRWQFVKFCERHQFLIF